MNLIKNLDYIKNIAKIVGYELIQFKQKNKLLHKWEEDQLKTNSDIFANNLWNKLLREKYLSFNIISEEDNSSNKKPDYKYTGFILDPIDGTRSYFENFKTYVTQIAYMELGKIIYSVVYAPELDKMFYAENSQGAYLNDKKIFFKDLKKKEINFKNIRLIDNYPKPSPLINKIMNLNNIKDYIESGSLGLKISLIASDAADLMIKPNICRIWDIAAPLLILDEARGKLFEYNKSPILLNESLFKSNFMGLIACSSNIKISNILFK